MKNRSNRDRSASRSQQHWAGIADAARQQATAASWDKPMRAATHSKNSSSNVKLHPGWDAAFRRARAS